MKPIIIIGTGKAAFLHYSSYKKFIKEKIVFVDIKKNNIYKFDLVFDSIKQATEYLNTTDVIVDIATPYEVFNEIINKCKELNLTNIIVEKPFFILQNKSYYNNMKIVMIQNYLYSTIFLSLKKILKHFNYKIILIKTNFSKNRILDSANSRAIINTLPNFYIELPHQIYMVENLLNKTAKVIFQQSKDFSFNNRVIKDHSYGEIIEKYGNMFVVHNSDMTTLNSIKQIEIICNKNIVINASFLIYDNALKKIENGFIRIYKNNEEIYNKIYLEDDNFTSCLKAYYFSFHKKVWQTKYFNNIVNFNNHYKKIKTNFEHSNLNNENDESAKNS